MKRRAAAVPALERAFDEARFGRARTLDFHASLPTARDAAERLEAWLRERQASVGGEVLVITGRGRGSEGGVSVLRPAVEQRLARLRRQGVVGSVREHTAGSFVVTLAPLRALLAAPARKKDRVHRGRDVPPELATLSEGTLTVLRALAHRSLELLGAPRTESMLNDEMAHQFSRLARAISAGPNREERLKSAAAVALVELSNDPD